MEYEGMPDVMDGLFSQKLGGFATNNVVFRFYLIVAGATLDL